MLTISATDEWRTSHPGAVIGLLECSGIDNSFPSPELDQKKRGAEINLREKYMSFSRQDLLTLPEISVYDRYYKRFEKTYHVQLQVESIVLKGKDLPSVSPLVDSNFLAEVQTFILTASHDVSKLEGDIKINASNEHDVMTLMNGTEKKIRAGDMVMRDDAGICCSIIYGQDNRSHVTAGTSHVLYVSYVPAGIASDIVMSHLQKILDNIRLVAPSTVIEQRTLLFADQ